MGMMLVPASSVTILCFLIELAESALSEHEQMLEDNFRTRSDDDWFNAWHKESHARCRESLFRHLYWACEKDIYKVTRRSLLADYNDVFSSQLIPMSEAVNFVRSRRGRKKRSSITRECCQVGCTWEEYAEYCPANRRIRKFTKK